MPPGGEVQTLQGGGSLSPGRSVGGCEQLRSNIDIFSQELLTFTLEEVMDNIWIGRMNRELCQTHTPPSYKSHPQRYVIENSES